MYSVYKGEYACVATTSSLAANASNAAIVAAPAATSSLPLHYPHPFSYILSLSSIYKGGYVCVIKCSHLFPCCKCIQRRCLPRSYLVTTPTPPSPVSLIYSFSIANTKEGMFAL